MLKKDKNGSPEWLSKLPQMAKQLEVSLYRNARSFEAYTDMRYEHVKAASPANCRASVDESTRPVLSHYRRCKDNRCLSCGPVRETIRKSTERERLRGQQASDDANSFDMNKQTPSNDKMSAGLDPTPIGSVESSSSPDYSTRQWPRERKPTTFLLRARINHNSQADHHPTPDRLTQPYVCQPLMGPHTLSHLPRWRNVPLWILNHNQKVFHSR